MALAYTRVANLIEGNARVAIVDFTGDNSYAAGGYTLASTDFESATGNVNCTGTSSVTFFVSELNASGYELCLDRTNSKLKFYLGSTEATTTTSSAKVRARITYSPVNYK